MRTRHLLVLLCSVALLGQTARLRPDPDKMAWMEQTLSSIQAIKPGMSRADLERLFQPDGGTHGKNLVVYVYRVCPYIKVSVTFADDSTGSPRDKIASISNPFIGRPVMD